MFQHSSGCKHVNRFLILINLNNSPFTKLSLSSLLTGRDDCAIDYLWLPVSTCAKKFLSAAPWAITKFSTAGVFYKIMYNVRVCAVKGRWVYTKVGSSNISE